MMKLLPEVRSEINMRFLEVDAVCGMVYSGFKTALSVGDTVCIQMPKRALVLCFTIQKELLLLPFRVINKVYDALVRRPVILLHSVYRVFSKEDPAPVELLTGQKNPPTEQIMSSVVGIRKAALKTIRRETRARTQMDMYRRQLESWRLENEKKTEEIYKLSLEEKDLMKGVASALRYLRSLKVKREKINDDFSDNIRRMMMEDGSVSAEKLLALQKKIKTIDATIKEKKDHCLDLLCQGNIDFSKMEQSAPKTVKKSQSSAKLQDGNISTELVHKALALIADENSYLKEKVCSSQSTLERILEISSSIHSRIDVLSHKLTAMTHLNQDMDDLQKKLEEEKLLLKAAEADRDIMKEKLETLESMIKEEESYLCDFTVESNFDSDYSSLSGGCDELTTVG